MFIATGLDDIGNLHSCTICRYRFLSKRKNNTNTSKGGEELFTTFFGFPSKSVVALAAS
jgi:hypothetical protein